MTATTMFSERWYDREFGDFLEVRRYVFHVFIAVAVMVYLVAVMVVAIMVCGRHGLWPSWYTPILSRKLHSCLVSLR